MDDVQRGDYVQFIKYFDDGVAFGTEQGYGYLEDIKDEHFFVRQGDRLIDIPFDAGTVNLHAKQYRLEV